MTVNSSLIVALFWKDYKSFSPLLLPALENLFNYWNNAIRFCAQKFVLMIEKDEMFTFHGVGNSAMMILSHLSAFKKTKCVPHIGLCYRLFIVKVSVFVLFLLLLFQKSVLNQHNDL